MLDQDNIKTEHPRTVLEMIKQMSELGVEEKDNEKWLWRYLEDKARRDYIPLHGKFELTPLCNLDCKMCYVHLENKLFPVEKLISAQVWISIIDAARKMGMMEATLTGGECLTCPGFDEIYLHLYSHGILTSILSNGVLMDQKRVEFFKRYPPKGIQITLYGSNEDAYEAVTGHRVFKNVMEGIERLLDAGLRVIIMITPNAYMQDDTQEIIRIAEEFGIHYHISSALLSPRENTGRRKAETNEELIMDLFRARQEYRKKQAVIRELCDVPFPNQRSDGETTEGVLCGAGRSNFAIMYDGRMSPCLAIDNITTRPIEQGFQKAWKELTEKMNHYQRPVECNRCAYRQVCLPCPAIHQEAPQGHCDVRICQRIYRMAVEGLI